MSQPDAAHPAAAARRLRDWASRSTRSACISPDVGGAFGSKIFCYADMALVHVRQQGDRRAAGQVGRGPPRELPVHDPRPRPHHVHRGRRAPATARSPASGSRRCANLGGRLSTIGPGIPTTLYGRVLSGPYKIPNVYCEVTGVYTNTDVRRRVPRRRPARGDLRRRAGDGPRSRTSSGIDPAEVRRRNFLPPDSFPYDNPSGLLTAVQRRRSSTSTRATTSRRSTRRWRWSATPTSARAKAEAKARGKLLGRRPLDLHRGLRRRAVQVDRRRRRGLGRRDVGVGQHQGPPDRQGRRHDRHPAPGPGPRDDLRPDHRPRAGRARWRTSSSSTRTRRARRSATARTGRGRRGRGRHGRRSRPRTRSARRRAATPRTCSRRTPDDIEVDGAELPRQGLARTRSRRIQEIAFATRPRLRPARGHGALPRRDRLLRHARTAPGRSGPTSRSSRWTRRPGIVDLVRYVAVDDVGKKINPMIVDGQLHGGIAQGVGQALWEGAVYDDDGQLLSGSMLDYALPRASWLPGLRARRDGHARRRSTRSASRASARRAPSPAPPPWPTPSSTR